MSESDELLLHKIVNEEPRPLGEVCPQAVPQGLRDLVVECLAKNPEDRPRSALAVIERLEALIGPGPWTQAQATRWWEDTYRGRRAE